MAKSIPKVLVIASWAPPMIGGPQNLYNLFSQFSASSYTVLTGYSALKSTGSIRGSWLPGRYEFYDYQGEFSKESFVFAQPNNEPSTGAHKLFAAAKKLPLFNWLLFPFFSLGKTYLMTRKATKILSKENYDVVIGVSDHGPALIASYLASRKAKKPLFVYLFDIYKGNNLLPYDRFIASRFEERFLTSAEQVLVTNEGTEIFYRQRYGNRVNLSVIYNSVFARDYEKKRTPYRPLKQGTILFTGHVYWAQEQAVLNLIKAISKINNPKLFLDLYIPGANEVICRAIKGKKNIRLLEATQSEMPSIQSRATLLFLPLAWDTASPDIIATATPGKLTDYMASGRPMLIHAPDYAFVAQYAKKHKLALVVDQNSIDALARSIKEFFAQPQVGQKLVDNALAAFYSDYDAVGNADKLAKLLAKVKK